MTKVKSSDYFFIQSFDTKFPIPNTYKGSEYFNSILSGRFKTSNTIDLNLGNDTKSSFYLMYSLIYLYLSGSYPENVVINREDMLGLAYLADFLIIDHIKNAILKKVKANPYTLKHEDYAVYYEKIHFLKEIAYALLMKETKHFSKLPEDIQKKLTNIGMNGEINKFMHLNPVTPNRIKILKTGELFDREDIRVETSKGKVYRFVMIYDHEYSYRRRDHFNINFDKKCLYETMDGSLIALNRKCYDRYYVGDHQDYSCDGRDYVYDEIKSIPTLDNNKFYYISDECPVR